ncbi:YihY/virulence factor BrkB family protein [Actinoplanes sp. Pm04-4]|uniref:YihY/virulence factor BrkB family protein n=1 Tax=Paractinoplanes pyxinae TaxID=2997416 RepID=A0ABT4ARL2_9ACTN|nr:YhjD/YihY/BrkB family envelope integrity protein [Actinoplanes pyxinae]MCY1136861.1 YihY/virulence factor BrkB family protein [Actinoplanes pyxinae]
MTTLSRRVLDAVPHPLRAAVQRLLGELVRVQIFDRAMTLAAQAFTSLFPLVIMIGALSGSAARDRLTDLIRLPADSTRLVQDALGGSRSGAFGVLGSLIVVLSATGLARALARAYRATWSVAGRRAGPADTGWQIGTVLLVVLFLIGVRLLVHLTDLLPAAGVAGVVVTLLADCGLAVLLPRVLLGPVVPRDRLLLGGLLFGLIMLGVRAAGAIYLPRALQSSTERYGTIGLAFTYIGWLYVLSFCLLLSAILAVVLADRLPRWFVRSDPAAGP